jgi:hypothetical protein
MWREPCDAGVPQGFVALSTPRSILSSTQHSDGLTPEWF